ncbi:MAG: ribosomal-processing cysteine protease Prp [Thermanaeromonas sp.]|uniref:ribosomal-processing cysteine protease Prp n=1 Tax=Thermanaeromonas sp. TaxID=2003697 RepID=UPI00243F654E|nr:ribosomal-processing cysteine protease Prp [Thermanaeromonas sp.]MCG0277588.1 ribosomal-processing cysteine protease Prp [Thermanaeromonas sp.]
MIHATLWLDREGSVVGFEISGHAGYAPRGRDIVCAAVSALAQATVLGLEEFLSRKPAVEMRKGRLRCQLAPDLSPRDRERAGAILGTLRLGLQAIKESYSPYIKIEIRRWNGCGE